MPIKNNSNTVYYMGLNIVFVLPTFPSWSIFYTNDVLLIVRVFTYVTWVKQTRVRLGM